MKEILDDVISKNKADATLVTNPEIAQAMKEFAEPYKRIEKTVDIGKTKKE